MMRTRALALGFLVVSVLAGALAARPAAAGVSAVGLIDYTKPNFKMGDWVRYKVEISTSTGLEDVNQQEVRIVGEETYRGERCFWVETWYGREEKVAAYDLALVSYDVFKDVAPDVHYRNYLRLVLLGLDNDGIPEMSDLKRSNPDAAPPDLRPYRGTLDTLGVEKVGTPRGEIEARLVRLSRRLARTIPQPDSTINRINETTRKTWISRNIPVTSVVKEEEVSDRKVQAYALGQPASTAPETIAESIMRTATVIDWGSGATSDLLRQWREGRGLLRTKAGAAVDEDPDLPR
jgi:hypothetical protein